MTQLVLKRASASRTSGEWKDDDYDVLAEGAVVGRIMKAAAAPVGAVAVDHPVLRRSSADVRLQSDARGRDGGIREKLAAGISMSEIARVRITEAGRRALARTLES